MIKKFEQFCDTVYSKPINEAFQSNKLRELIKQHGMPKYKTDFDLLYDIKDSDIIDVLDGSENLYKKYDPEKDFIFNLGDGTDIIIRNIDSSDKQISKDYYRKHRLDYKYLNKSKKNILKKHAERHEHNTGTQYEDKLVKNMLIKKIKPIIPEIVEVFNTFVESDDDIYKYHFNEELILDCCDGNIDVLIEEIETYNHFSNLFKSIEKITGLDESCGSVTYHCYRKSDGCIYCDLVSFCLDIYYNGQYYSISNEDFDITKKTYKDLFSKETYIGDPIDYVYSEKDYCPPRPY